MKSHTTQYRKHHQGNHQIKGHHLMSLNTQTQANQDRNVEVGRRCFDVVQQYRRGHITKVVAILQFQQIIPHETLEQVEFIKALELYTKMLDNFDHFKEAASAHSHTISLQLDEHGNPNTVPDGQDMNQIPSLLSRLSDSYHQLNPTMTITHRSDESTSLHYRGSSNDQPDPWFYPCHSQIHNYSSKTSLETPSLLRRLSPTVSIVHSSQTLNGTISSMGALSTLITSCQDSSQFRKRPKGRSESAISNFHL